MFRKFVCFGAVVAACFTWAGTTVAQQNNCDPRLYGEWSQFGGDTVHYKYTFNADGTIQHWIKLLDDPELIKGSEGSWYWERAQATFEQGRVMAYECVRPDALMMYYRTGERCLVLIDFLPDGLSSWEWMHAEEMIRNGGADCPDFHEYDKRPRFRRTN